MTKHNKQAYPAGWDEERIRKLAEHYDNQTEDEQFAEYEAAFLAEGQTIKGMENRSLLSLATALISVVSVLIITYTFKMRSSDATVPPMTMVKAEWTDWIRQPDGSSIERRNRVFSPVALTVHTVSHRDSLQWIGGVVIFILFLFALLHSIADLAYYLLRAEPPAWLVTSRTHMFMCSISLIIGFSVGSNTVSKLLLDKRSPPASLGGPETTPSTPVVAPGVVPALPGAIEQLEPAPSAPPGPLDSSPR